jgi:three-Cys-motif partner protein
MVEIPESYRDREQSYIKHLFLTEYLREAALKVLQARSPVFNFVDAFAGPWQVSDGDNYTDASFNQALHTLETVRSYLTARGLKGLRIRFCFCEKRPEAVDRLKTYARRHSNFEINVFQGKFEDNLNLISSAIPGGFTFTFMDPTGWDISNAEVFRFLKDQKGEFLLNFMSDHINRHADYHKVDDSFRRFLANPEWKHGFDELPSTMSNEERVLHLLRQKIKSSGVARFAPDFSIMVPRKDRIKMRLILGTNSKIGLEVFRDVHARIEKTEIKVRERIRDEPNPQMSLFTSDESAQAQQMVTGVGGQKVEKSIEAFLLTHLSEVASKSFEALAVEILEDFPIRLTQLRDLMGRLREKGLVSFDIPAGKRKIQDATRVKLNG